MFSLGIDDEVELHLLEERHAEELASLRDQNREYLREWLPWVDESRSVENIRQFIRRSLEQFENKSDLVAGIWYRGKLVGCIGLHGIDQANRKAGIGYWLDASSQSKGVMTRACRALIDYAFNERGLNRVEIRVAARNRRSRAIPERLGFTQEGVMRQAAWLNDRFVDLVVYGILASEWRDASRRTE